ATCLEISTLVDKKKVVVTEAAIKDAFHLDDTDGVDCLPNEEICNELARMGYEKPTTKLTFYKAFFSSQWKFLIHTILQSMSAKCTSWNEFSSAMASTVICLSTGRKFNFSKYIFKSLVRIVDSSTKFYMYPRFITLMIQNQLGDLSTHFIKYLSPALTQKVFANIRRVGNGCLGVETPLLEGMLIARELENQVNEEAEGDDEEQGTAAEEPITAAVDDDQSIPSPTPLTPPPQQPQDIPSTSHLERANKVKYVKLRRLRKVGTSQRIESSADTIMEDVSNQGRMIEESNKDDAEAAKVVNEQEETEEVRVNAANAQVEGRQAEIYHIDMDHAAKVLSMQEEEEPEVHEAVEVVTTAKLITEVVAATSGTVSAAAVVPTHVTTATITPAPVKVAVPATRRRRGVIIRDPAEESSTNTPAETKSKYKGKGILVEEPKPMKKKQQVKMDEAFARKLQEEFNQEIDWQVAMKHNTAGYILDYFKGMSYDDIRPIFKAKFKSNLKFLLKTKEQIEEEDSRAIAIINETSAQKAAKRRRLNEEAEDVEELKKHLEIVPDEDDDVYIEATSLARKVLVVDYQIIKLDNKPRYKIIRADDTHQLYRSFITMLKIFDREDLETLWNSVKERFSTSNPNNFSDEYLLSTLKTMFRRPDGQDNVWRNQSTVHGQALVKSWKLLTSCGVYIISVCPHHGFSEFHQLNTFYNALNINDQDSLNSAAGGNFLDKMPRECLKIIESKSKVRQSRAKTVIAKVATSRNVYRDNIQEYVSQAAAANYNQGNTGFRPQMVANQIRPPEFPPHQNHQNNFNRGNNFNQNREGSGTLPSNTITNPKEDLKGITIRSGAAYQGPPIPTKYKVMKQGTKPVVAPISVPIPYPLRRDNERRRDQANEQIEKFYEIFKEMSFEISFTDALILMPKFASTLKALIGNKEKLSEMARTSMNEHCSAVILNKLPRKLGDPGKFLIPYEFPGMDECLELADLGASINLMPLFVWEGLSLPELTLTYMTLELADRSTLNQTPRVPLILGRCFLKTGRALIDVHKGELTLHIENEAITYNLDQTVRYSANYNQMTANKIDVICEMYSQEVLGFSDVTVSGNPTPYDDLIVSTTLPTLTPFGDSDFLLFKEADAFLGLEDDPDSPKINPFYYDPEGDILLLEPILNSKPLPPIPNHKQY
nr:reverse transcriptase domain-containing protein [Tanacetum cinerariifolium]